MGITSPEFIPEFITGIQHKRPKAKRKSEKFACTAAARKMLLIAHFIYNSRISEDWHNGLVASALFYELTIT